MTVNSWCCSQEQLKKYEVANLVSSTWRRYGSQERHNFYSAEQSIHISQIIGSVSYYSSDDFYWKHCSISPIVIKLSFFLNKMPQWCWSVEVCVRNLCWPFSSACESGRPTSFPHFIPSSFSKSLEMMIWRQRAWPGEEVTLSQRPFYWAPHGWLWLTVDLSPKLNFLLPMASPCCPLPATFVFIWPTSQGTHSYLWLSGPGSRVRCACQAFSLWLSPAPKLNCSVTSCHPGSTTSPLPLANPSQVSLCPWAGRAGARAVSSALWSPTLS